MFFLLSLLALTTACSTRQNGSQQTSPVQPSTPQTGQLPASPLQNRLTDGFAPTATPEAASVLSASEPVSTPAPTIISPALASVRPISPAHYADTLIANMSVDGRFVVFSTDSDELSLADDNGFSDVYLLDNTSGELRLVSINDDGAVGDSWSGGAAVSIDGSVVVYYSWAGNLTEGDANFVQDLFVYDAKSDRTERITRSGDGGPANDRSGDSDPNTRPAMSVDGRYVAFQSMASNLVDGDTNGYADVFVYDREDRRMSLVSVGITGVQGNGPSVHPALSADGRYIAFESQATNLDGHYNADAGVSQIYMHDRIEQTTKLVSISSDQVTGDGSSYAPAISGDGQTILFASDSDNLAPDDANCARDIFVRDLRAGTTELVSVNRAGVAGNGDSSNPSISLDGRYVAYLSNAANLVDADNNGLADVFVYDRLAKNVQRVSLGIQAPGIGVEANGPSVSTPIISAGGAQVLYASYGTNIAADARTTEQPEFAQVYQVDLVELPTFNLNGRVLDAKNQPLSGVRIGAGVHGAFTDADGNWAISYLPPGLYTVEATRDDLQFDTARQSVYVVDDTNSVNFIGHRVDGKQLPFLSFPIGSMSVPEMLQALGDLDEGGWVDAWVDHDAPDYRKNGAVTLWDGITRSAAAYNRELGCYERRCYDGHGGTDFPYRDPEPSTRAYEPLIVRAAADGTVAHVVGGCQDGVRWCNGGYGNEIILLHKNGYFTRYAHLAGNDGGYLPENGALIHQGVQLGIMGNSGNSYGVHLHFAVHQDNGNGVWDGEDVDYAADPFGWVGEGVDPWLAHAVSFWMWNQHATVTQLQFGSYGGEIRDQADELSVVTHPNAVSGQVRLELDPNAPVASPQNGMRRIGQPFQLQVIDWYPPDGESVQASRLDNLALSVPMSIKFMLDAQNLTHINVEKARVVRWDSASELWFPLPTEVHPEGLTVTGQSEYFGRFDLQAPLLCPADEYEPDDAYYSAVFLQTGDILTRLFDVQEDIDRFRLDSVGGQELTITVEPQNDDLAVDADFVGADGLTALGHASSRPNASLEMVFTPPHDGAYFIRLEPQGKSSTGCDAAYTIAVR